MKIHNLEAEINVAVASYHKMNSLTSSMRWILESIYNVHNRNYQDTDAGVENFFLPRATWRFVTLFMGPTKLSI